MQQIAEKIPFYHRLDPHLREVVVGAGESLVLRVIGAGLAFLFNMLLARVLGAQEAGIYFLALTITTTGSVLGRLGLDNSLLRFIAANAATTRWEEVAGVYRKGLLLAITLSGGVTLLLVACADWISKMFFNEPSLADPLRVMSLSIVPYSLLTLYGELLRALKHIGESALVQAVGVSSISLILLGIIQGRRGAVGVCAIYALSCAVIMALAITLWRRATPMLVHLHGKFDTRLLLTTSLPLFWTALMQIAIGMAGSIALGIWANSADIAIFNVAFRTAALTSFILIATNSIAAPKFAAFYAVGDRESLGRLARSSAAMTSLATIPLLLILLIVPGWVMSLFGDEFQSGALAVALLAVGQFVNVATGSVSILLVMTGHEKVARNKTAIWTVLYLLLLGVLVSRLKLTGAAIATMLTLMGDNLTGVWLVYSRLSILTLPFPRWSELKGKAGHASEP